MTVLPIVERELRAASRRSGTYWSRTATVLLGLVICSWCFVTSSQASVRDIGQGLFLGTSLLVFGVTLFLGAVYTADCLSREKREGTLGLLFLTDLKGYDIVLGKLVAHSVNAFYGVLALLPLLALPLLIGGVAPGEFGRLVLVLVNTLFFSLAAGVLVSSVMRSARHAILVTVLLVMSVNLLGPVVGLWVTYRARLPGYPEAFLVSSAGYAYALIYEPLFRTRAAPFYESLAITHGLAWCWLVLASIAARYSWREKTQSSWSLRQRWRHWIEGGPASRRSFRRRLLEINPAFWLASRVRARAALVWGFLAVTALIWVGCRLRWRDDWDVGINVAVLLVVHTVLRCWIAIEASQGLGPDRQSGALELLLSTPLSVRSILRGQMLALERQFLNPALCVVGADLMFLLSALRDHASEPDFSIAGFLAAIAVFLFDLYALAWVGLWLGLTLRHPGRAWLVASGLVLLVPWAVLFAGSALMSLARIRLPQPADWSALFVYFAVGIGFDILVVVWAELRLTRELRLIATRAFDHLPGWWMPFATPRSLR